MKTDMGEQKSNPSTPNLKKRPSVIILQPNGGWGLGRLGCHVEPHLTSSVLSHTCGTLKTQLFTYRYYVMAYVLPRRYCKL